MTTTHNTPETYGSFRMRAVGSTSLVGAQLFRSGELTDISNEEAEELYRRYGVRLVCDVRSQWEIAAKPAPAVGRFDYVATLPSFERRRKDSGNRLVAGVIGEYGTPGERMLSNYRRYATKYPGIGRAIRAIAAEGVPALIHCVNGKDRTGVLCATLMKAAGAHPDDITEDYLAVNTVNAELIEAEAEKLSVGMSTQERETLMSFLEARPEYLTAFFDEAKATFGSFDTYLSEGIGLTYAGRNTLAELLGR